MTSEKQAIIIIYNYLMKALNNSNITDEDMIYEYTYR